MGATSLAFEVLWTRILVFYLGSSVYAFSLMLLGFLLGIALGSLAIGRMVDRLVSPFALLAAVELGIAATAPLSIWLFTTLNGRQIALSEALHPQSFGVAIFAQLLAVLPILLPPTLLMGVSFPLLVRVYSVTGKGGDPGAASASAATWASSTAPTRWAASRARSAPASCSFRSSAPRTRCSRSAPSAPCWAGCSRTRRPGPPADAGRCAPSLSRAGAAPGRSRLPPAGGSRHPRRRHLRLGPSGRPGPFPRGLRAPRWRSATRPTPPAPISRWS